MLHSIYRRTFFLFIKLRRLCLVRCTLQVPFCLELAAVNFYNYYLVSVFVLGFDTFLIFFFVFVLFLLADNSQVNLTCQVCFRNPRLVSTRRTRTRRPYDQIPV